jgi:Icc protein
MPITLPPLSRRRFLAGSLAASTAILLRQSAYSAQAASNPHHIALLSDVHIHADKAFLHKTKVNMWKNLEQATGEVLALADRPAAVIVNGDCAFHQGLPGDYATFIEAMGPFRAAGLPVHCTLGNHDKREVFWKAVAADELRQKEVVDRHITIMPTPRADFIMLDSLTITDKAPGALGEKQLAWLGKTLDARGDKPVILMVHHQPDERELAKRDGLVDTPALMEILLPRKQVKAYIFGHTHDWHHEVREGLHLLNLPPTAWLFKPEKPNGWVDMKLGEGEAAVELRCIDVKHAQHGQRIGMKWR